MPIQIPSGSDTDFDVEDERDLEPHYTPTREPLLSTDGLLDNPCPDAFVEDSAELPPFVTPEEKGTSVDSVLDPLKVSVEIADRSTPVVLLVGPPASGKTMMLVRLTRWLKNKGYTVTPVRTFRPSDGTYEKMCDDFNAMVSSNEAAAGTNVISFMLVKVSYNGHPICQILEAPGEHYHSPYNPESDFPPYIHRIIQTIPNRRVFVILTDADYKLQRDEESRKLYVDKIRRIRRLASPMDRFIVVFNKVDLTDYTLGKGNYNKREAYRAVRNFYPGVFEIFENKHPITRFFKPSDASFVAFQSGVFTASSDGKSTTFTAGADGYAEGLWKQLLNYCK